MDKRPPADLETAPAGPAPDRAASGIALALVVVWVTAMIWRHWGHWPEDLTAVYVAGWLWQAGQPELIYAVPTGFFGGAAEAWGPVLQTLGIAGDRVFPFVYPPLWAVLGAPVTAVLGPQAFADALSLILVPMLGASVFLAARILRPVPMSPALWVLISLALLAPSVVATSALMQMQPTIAVTFLTLLAFERLGAGRPLSAGVVLALAAAIKLTPALFVLVFLLDRQYRAALAFAMTGAMLALASLALAGPGLHEDFLHSLSAVSHSTLLAPVNVSLRPALVALAALAGAGPPLDLAARVTVVTPVPRWITLWLAVAAAALILAFGRRLARLGPERRRGIGLFALSLLVPLFGPLGWMHYHLLPMLLLPGLFGLLPLWFALPVVALVWLPLSGPVFAMLATLPWPAAGLVWIVTAGWLAVLAALFFAARPDARR